MTVWETVKKVNENSKLSETQEKIATETLFGRLNQRTEWLNTSVIFFASSLVGQNDKRMLENMTATNLFKTKLISCYSLCAFSCLAASGIFLALFHWF